MRHGKLRRRHSSTTWSGSLPSIKPSTRAKARSQPSKPQSPRWGGSGHGQTSHLSSNQSRSPPPGALREPSRNPPNTNTSPPVQPALDPALVRRTPNPRQAERAGKASSTKGHDARQVPISRQGFQGQQQNRTSNEGVAALMQLIRCHGFAIPL